MKRWDGKHKVEVYWLSHQFACAKCRRVDLTKTATLALTCAEGGPLLIEHLAKKNAPARAAKAEAELEFALNAGAFHIPNSIKIPERLRKKSE